MSDGSGFPNQSLDILRVARAIYPESMGGGSIHVHEISKQQAEMGHNVTVVTSDRGNSTLPRVEKRAGYTIRRYDELFTPFGNSFTPGVANVLKSAKSEYDIVHAHSHLSFLSNVAAFFSRIGNAPFVITNHGIQSQTAPDWVQQLYLPTVGRFTFNSADRVFTYSREEQDRLRSLGITVPISVIHNGVDCSQFAPEEGANESLQLLFIGRLLESKGPHLLVAIFDELQSEYPELRLKIVGQGPMKNELLENISDRGLDGYIDLVGEVPNNMLPDFYNESSVFVLPTSREGVPRTILEAMACGTPVVSTNLPQVRSVVDDGGVVVEREIDSLTTVICNLLESPDRRVKMGKRGRNRVLNNYSWQETVRKTTNQYYEVLEAYA